MQLTASFGLLQDFLWAIKVAFVPTVKAVWKSPRLLLRPKDISRIFMSEVWVLMGPGIDENTVGIKKSLITPNASGVVLDLGAGRRYSRPLSARALSQCENHPC